MKINIKVYIKTVIDKLFPNLNVIECGVLTELIHIIVDTLMYKLNLSDNINKFISQLTENDNRDMIGIIYLILPYIDDKNDYELFKKIKRLEDITCLKTNDKNEINKYVITNFQYSRYFEIQDDTYFQYINKFNFFNKTNKIYEYKFNILDLEIATKLVLDTIELVNSKLYINWINIIPLTINNFKESKKYKNNFYYDNINGKYKYKTINGIEKDFDFWDLEYSNDLRRYSGMSANDLFNTIYVYLFKDLYESGTKWLIYEKQIINNMQPIKFIDIISEIIDIKYLYNNIDYDILDIHVVNMLSSNWNKIINNVLINKDSEFYDFLKVFIFKFDYYYDSQNNNNYDYESFYKKYNIFNPNTEPDEDLFLNVSKDNMEQDYRNKIIEFRDKIEIKEIYMFLINKIKIFKRTWYGKQILNGEKINKKLYFKNKIKIRRKYFYITYKNIYNYAKYVSLSFYENKYSDARCLTKKDKELFFNKLNGNDDDFNITNVLKKTYKNISSKDCMKIQKFISSKIKTKLVNLVFETHIQFGLLNEFIIDSSLTNDELLPRTENEKKNAIKEKLISKYKDKKYLEAYYYLTSDKYMNLELYNKNGDKIDYFDYTFKENDVWHSFYTFNWISQINFFHHYINNRVMFVTGSTGQGKSTHVPKLLHYALFSINLNNNARVLSTQPTIQPTILNAETIASQLGVPIKINTFPTFNGYVQYSTQGDKHIIHNEPTYIKEVTDRTLLEEILKNPYLKHIINENNLDPNKNKYLFNKNKYDIIIIDEAHMHNINMDIILSIMRNILFINNQIKLIITSATMDDDEYIYRRYYRLLDDNFSYPIVSKYCKLEHSYYLTHIENMFLDKIVIDRRYHISPPGQTTNFKVNEIYLENDTLKYEDSELEALKIVLQLVKQNEIGDILFFTITESKVNELVEKINSFTPRHVIALPLYSKLKQKGDWFNTIATIHNTLSKINYSKQDILNVILNGPDKYNKIQESTYTMAIIVATNVVEASVTMPSLKFVIDTGYYNNVEINQETFITQNLIEKISEVSRIQRRGRIGRVATGYVYYSYKKNSRKFIKPKYGIETSDILLDIYKLLDDNTKKLIYDIKEHPFKFNQNIEYIDQIEFKSNELNKNTKTIYENQYKYRPNLNLYINGYYYSDNKVCNMYINGYDIMTLLDRDGIFYIIHPEESRLKRNVLTGKTKYISNKIIYMINRLKDMKYIYFEENVTERDIKEKRRINIYKFKHNEIIETIIKNEQDQLKIFENIDIEKLIKIFCLSFSYNCTEQVIKILSLLYSINDLQDLIIPKFKNIKKFLSMYLIDYNSELINLLHIMNQFTSFYNIDNNIKEIKYNDNKYLEFLRITKHNKNDIFFSKNIKTILTNQEINEFVNIKNLNYDLSKRKKIYKSNKINSELEDTLFKNVCLNLSLNHIAIKKAIKIYYFLYAIYNNINYKDGFDWFKKFYPVIKSDLNENIIKCFLELNINNIIYYDGNNFYDSNKLKREVPKTLLVKLTNNYYFSSSPYSDNILGLSLINKRHLSHVSNTKIIKSLSDLDIQVIKLNKFKFDKTAYSMNHIIKFSMNEAGVK
jgi:hypothetical protein